MKSPFLALILIPVTHSPFQRLWFRLSVFSHASTHAHRIWSNRIMVFLHKNYKLTFFCIKMFGRLLEKKCFLEASMTFYIKIITRFAGFFRVQIHFWNVNILWTLQFTSSEREAAWYWAVPSDHSFYIMLVTVMGRGGKRELWGEKRWRKLT